MPLLAWAVVALLGGGLFVGGCSTGVNLRRVQEDIKNFTMPSEKTTKAIGVWVKVIIVGSAVVVVIALWRWLFAERRR